MKFLVLSENPNHFGVREASSGSEDVIDSFPATRTSCDPIILREVQKTRINQVDDCFVGEEVSEVPNSLYRRMCGLKTR